MKILKNSKSLSQFSRKRRTENSRSLRNLRSSRNRTLRIFDVVLFASVFAVLGLIFAPGFFAKKENAGAASTDCSLNPVKNFANLQSCFAQATAGNTLNITVGANISMTASVNVPDNATINLSSVAGQTYSLQRSSTFTGGELLRVGYGSSVGGATLNLTNIIVDGMGAPNNASTGLVANSGLIAVGNASSTTVAPTNMNTLTIGDGAIVRNNYSVGSVAILAWSSTVNVLPGAEISNNSSGIYGSAIGVEPGNYTTPAYLNISGGTISGNAGYGTTNAAAAVYVAGDTKATITGGTFANNSTASSDPVGAAILFEATARNQQQTVSGATFANNTSASVGGAIYIGSSTSVDISNCDFENNTAAAGAGGAIFYGDNSNISSDITAQNISGSIFRGNSSSTNNGGAIGASPGNYTLAITNSTFSNNKSAADGGALVAHVPMTITDSTFSGNIAAADGGAIRFDTSPVTINGNTKIINGVANSEGGGIYVGKGGSLTLNDATEISGNIANGLNSAYAGGGVMLWQATGLSIGTNTPSSENTVSINNNYALNAGGGGVAIASDTTDSAFTMRSGEIRENYACGYGGGIRTDSTDTADIRVMFLGLRSQIIGNRVVKGGTTVNGYPFNCGDTVGEGGGINIGPHTYIWSSATDFINNQADTNGGAVRFTSINPDSTGPATFQSTTFTRNIAGENGGAIGFSDQTAANYWYSNMNILSSVKFANNSASTLQRATNSTDIATYNANIATTSWSVPNTFNGAAAVGYNNYDIQYQGVSGYQTVTFDAQGGTNPPAAQTVMNGGFANLPSTVPTLSQHVFGGWYVCALDPGDSGADLSLDTDDECGPWDFANYPVDQDLTFYASWTESQLNFTSCGNVAFTVNQNKFSSSAPCAISASTDNPTGFVLTMSWRNVLMNLDDLNFAIPLTDAPNAGKQISGTSAEYGFTIYDVRGDYYCVDVPFPNGTSAAGVVETDVSASAYNWGGTLCNVASGAKLSSQNAKTYSSKIQFGASAGNLPNGTYTGNVLYTIVANP